MQLPTLLLVPLSTGATPGLFLLQRAATVAVEATGIHGDSTGTGTASSPRGKVNGGRGKRVSVRVQKDCIPCRPTDEGGGRKTRYLALLILFVSFLVAGFSCMKHAAHAQLTMPG